MSDTKRPVDSEEEIITRAQEAVSQCRWVVGECAAQWTARYARGRTDGDFAVMIGISGDQVYQRRRVWETFHEIRGAYPWLKWSHFYAALNWEDAKDCLDWAEETHSTVAEMRAWRRAQRGEDLTVDAPEEEFQYVPSQPEFVQNPEGYSGEGSGVERQAGEADPERAVLAGVARQLGGAGEEYTPFKTGATAVPNKNGKGGGASENGSAAAEALSTEQLAKRFTATVERFNKLITADFRKDFRDLPAGVKERFLNAITELRDHVSQLK